MGGRGGAGYAGGTRALYNKVKKPWGGATINQNTGKAVPDNADAYAVATTDTIEIPEDATYAQFARAYARAQARFGGSSHIGIFHDNAKGTIEFNGATVVKSTADVDKLWKAGNPITGGAYHFKTGNGYWPQGRPAQYAA